MKKGIKNPEFIRTGLMLLVLFVCMSAFAIIQPFGDGPDEINRFKIVEYIYKYGSLPAGDHPEVLLDGYGASYAFQPMLTYIIDGFLLRILSFMGPDLATRVLISRFVNVIFGLLTAFYTRRLARLLFKKESVSWLFTLLVVFLPQNMFVHTYVNTDSMGLLSVAIILYAIFLGSRNDYSLSACLHMTVGVILCALSYYNCYGIILCGILAFLFANFKKDAFAGKLFFDWKMFFKKGILISVLVLLGISWWFIRNAILYNGDFLALEARQICAAQTCIEQYNPFTRETYQRLGIPVLSMIFDTDFYILVSRSFIAMFGPMNIPTHYYIYTTFKRLIFLALICTLIPIKSSAMKAYSFVQKSFYNVIMLLALAIPVFLAIYYSYTWEYQPQGRYLLPMVIPFMYFITIGIEKLISLIVLGINKVGLVGSKSSSRDNVGRVSQKIGVAFELGVYHLLYLFLLGSLTYCTFITMMRFYGVW